MGRMSDSPRGENGIDTSGGGAFPAVCLLLGGDAKCPLSGVLMNGMYFWSSPTGLDRE